jgi:hypothetical protein
MIEERVRQLETDVRILISLVAKLETEVHVRATETQQAIQGLEKRIADLRMLVDESGYIRSGVRTLS